ncbi:MAG: hypothetical protein JWO45_1480 [Spartobacteria bacterium]|nr:hypothetical protein [Spartobacteria bacterium]
MMGCETPAVVTELSRSRAITEFMTKRKTEAASRVATVAVLLMLVLSGCKNQQGHLTNQVPAVVGQTAQHLDNGVYLSLRESSAPQEAQAIGAPSMVLTYDRRKYSGAPANEPLTYVAIDSKDFVPLIIEGAPEMKSDGRGKSILTVSLARKNAERLEAFTRAHLHGRIALIVDGEIVTLHKVQTVVTGGKLQITRCTDGACEVIRAKLVN